MEEIVFGSRMNIKKGTVFFRSGDTVERIYLIVNGQVQAGNDYMKMNLENGALAGVLDVVSGEYMFNYEAVTDLVVLCFPITKTEDVKKILNVGKNYQEIAVNSLFAQFQEVYRFFAEKAVPYLSELDSLNAMAEKEDAVSINLDSCTYMCQIFSLDKKIFHELFTAGILIAYEHICRGSLLLKDMDKVLLKLIDSLGKSTLGIEEDKAAAEEVVDSVSNDSAEDNTDTSEYDYELVDKELSGSLKTILDFSGLEAQEASHFTVNVSKYMNLSDRNSTDNAIRTLRREIADTFYVIYEKVFFNALNVQPLPRAIELFLNFGFMDEKEFDREALADLYYFKPNFNNSAYNMYTIYEWLMAIYTGKREPSKDEFDQDYKENVRQQKAQKRLTPAEETAMLSDQKAKVQFEIRNMFKVINRLTTNEITIFSPILTQKKFESGMRKIFLSASRFANIMDNILNVDFSLFHREQMYYDPENKIDNIMVMKKVLPDIILMPNVGSRGIMWQDISEKKRDTPARFVLSAFFVGNLESTLLNMSAAYRWEICRTVQGNYWNDVREHSLTSEYCDYVQFYRKNKDLTEEAKEKVKAQMQSARNSFREMFAKDYEIWIKYESQNSVRLNKVARGIMYMYCPFAAEYRKKLESHPIFSAAAQRYERHRVKKVKELKNFNTNVLKRNGQITDVLQSNLDFYELG